MIVWADSQITSTLSTQATMCCTSYSIFKKHPVPCCVLGGPAHKNPGGARGLIVPTNPWQCQVCAQLFLRP